MMENVEAIVEPVPLIMALFAWLICASGIGR